MILRDTSHYVAGSNTLSEYSKCVRQLAKLFCGLFDDHLSSSK